MSQNCIMPMHAVVVYTGKWKSKYDTLLTKEGNASYLLVLMSSC